MPGAGKSTIGLLLAKKICKRFLDVDVYVQTIECRLLRDIINDEGLIGFGDIEEKHVLSIHVVDTVISTGGSVIYSDKAMIHLKKMGPVVFLSVPLDVIIHRLGDLSQRGVIIGDGMSITDLYEERDVLYRKYADFIIDCKNYTQGVVVQEVMDQLSETSC